MAEILLGAVVSKLAEFTVEKVLQLSGVTKEVEHLKSLKDIVKEAEKLKTELSYIQAFIKDADKRCIVDQTQKQWVKDLIEIAYQIEDALDIFFLECPTAVDDGNKSVSKKKLRLPCLGNCCEKMINMPIKILRLPFLTKFQEEMKNIQQKIKDIHENGEKYKTEKLGEVCSGQNTRSSGLKLDPIGDPEVVGFDEDVKNIVNKLCDDNNKRLAVVSIVGPGGLGKTTLAQKVRCSEKVKKEFGEPAWVTISQMYDLLYVLRKIAKSFLVESTDLNMNELADKIREHLTTKKYLIILDDVWTKELWVELKKVMPDTKNGSRILITTRLVVDVALKADTLYEPHRPKFLNDDESRDLFLKKAIPRNLQRSEVEPNLKELPDKFIRKCKGLPLALEVLGSLLCTNKPCNYHAWRELLETMNWHDDGADCSKAIATSFEHLPYAMKFCFMYFATFPEDHEIKAKTLLRMWIAEGLIPQEETRTLEQIAERILEDLVQRSMVQVASRNKVDGSIKSLRVHDILRDLAVEKAKENNFLAVCAKQADWNLEHWRNARRVAVHYSDFTEHIQYASSNLRSLLVFGRESNLDCSKFRLLRVLAESHTYNDVEHVQGFTGLSHLKYLQLYDPLGSEHGHGRVRNLEAQTLETVNYWSPSRNILGDTWKIKTLRHVITRGPYIDGPPASTNLPNLQTLKSVTACSTWSTSQLPNIFGVRKLGISVERDSLDVIAALLGKLNHLVSLHMCGNILIQMFEGVFRFPEKLKAMTLLSYGIPTAQELKDDMLPPNLIKLELDGFEFKSDPMPVLEKLGSLKFLSIRNSNSKYPLRISCSAGGFKQLEMFDLMEIELLQEWKIELGAMPMLKDLHVSECKQLPVPQPKWFIDHKNLQHLVWWKDSETPELQEANKSKLSEIFNARPDMAANNL